MNQMVERIFGYISENGMPLKKNEDYQSANKSFGKLYEKIYEGLNDEQRKLMDELYDCIGTMEYEFGKTYFCEGIKLALEFAFLP